MKLIAISEDVLINPDKISVMQIVKKKNRQVLTVDVEGRTLTVERMAAELIKELNNSGVDLSDQFFAG